MMPGTDIGIQIQKLRDVHAKNFTHPLALCFLILTTCAFAELTQSDFEKIQSIVEKSEKQIKEYVDLKIDAVNAKIDAIDMKIDTKIDAVNTRIDAVNESVGRNFYLITSTFALIVVAVGIPQIIIAIQSKKYDKLVDDVEMLKQQRIASP